MNIFSRMMRRWARRFKHRNQVQSFHVWTKDKQGSVFSYEIRVAACMNGKANRCRYLARFDRTRLGGNTLRFYRVLSAQRAQELMLRAA